MTETVSEQRPVFAPWLDDSQQPLIRFENVTKRFGDFLAIDNLSLDIYEREFFALLGSSGCGKTTLLRMLAGFEQPTEGRILLGGKDLSNIPPNKRPVNMMFQSYALFPHMTVAQNIAFGLKQEGRNKAAIKQRVEEMLSLVQLQDFAKRKPHQLSGGQRQRVALARSLAKGPKLLLLDEPLGALDKKLRQQTQFELMNLQEQLGLTFVIVTHDQEEAMTVASRIAVMNKGLVQQVDTPADIYEHPQSRFVAEFIGDVNILEGTVQQHSEALSDQHQASIHMLLDSGDKLVIDPDLNQTVQAKAAQPISIAIRPEKLSISREQPQFNDGRPRNHLRGKVWDIAYSGNMSTYHVKLANGTMMKAQVANQRRVSERSITWEDHVWLSWATTASILLEQ